MYSFMNVFKFCVCNKIFTHNIATSPLITQCGRNIVKRPIFVFNRNFTQTTNYIAKGISKKRSARVKWSDDIKQIASEGKFNVMAFATAEEYNLEGLVSGLVKQDLYHPKSFFSTDNLTVEPDVLYVKAKYEINQEPRDIFFFREGTTVLWNISEIECSNILAFLKAYEVDSYDEDIVHSESEIMPYTYNSSGAEKPGCKNNQFNLSHDKTNPDIYLEKYTFSNALSLSVKLGVWEASLTRYIDSVEDVTNDLKKGNKFKITRNEMLQKTGELFALKHLINLSSDLLDTPDFYWDREDLENLYSKVCAYFSINRRTRVMNEKINHCVELADLISSNLNDIHHVRLEWMIIILIMVEVLFEVIHYVERYLS